MPRFRWSLSVSHAGKPPALEAIHLLERMSKHCLHIGKSLFAKDSLMMPRRHIKLLQDVLTTLPLFVCSICDLALAIGAKHREAQIRSPWIICMCFITRNCRQKVLNSFLLKVWFGRAVVLPRCIFFYEAYDICFSACLHNGEPSSYRIPASKNASKLIWISQASSIATPV
jgi:hypothetical protein